MNRGKVRRRSGNAWFQGKPSPPAELDFAIRDLRARCRRLERNPANEELHNHCGAEVEHLKHLTQSLELEDGIREAALSVLAETEQWLDGLPVARRRRLVSSPYSDTW